eukprot:SAG22_NODE_5639_length_979_cov_0.913636_1_plen_105_part_00
MVASPLRSLTKDQVRATSKELDLPNWSHAASPCLRSRLALNVEVGTLAGRDNNGAGRGMMAAMHAITTDSNSCGSNFCCGCGRRRHGTCGLSKSPRKSSGGSST